MPAKANQSNDHVCDVNKHEDEEKYSYLSLAKRKKKETVKGVDDKGTYI
jgi:hypothetical protein